MKVNSRRTFISLVGTGVFGATSLCSTTSASSQSILKGKIVDYNGDPIAHRQVTLSIRRGGHKEVTSDEKGRFEAELPSNETCDIGFYKYKYGPKNSEPNGVPHVYVIGEYSTGTGETDLGKLRIEKGHLVQAQALDSDGNAVGNANADLTVKGESGHYLGTGGNLRTNHNGYVVIDDGPYTGMELTGTVELSISIPNGNGGAIEYSREIFVEEPLSLTAQIGEGITLSSSDGESSDSANEASDSENNSGTSDDTQAEEKENTEVQNKNETLGNSSNTSEESKTKTARDNREKNRGFFSNDAAGEEFEMLSDPFTLTVGGFVLSAGGIAHQLIRGR